MHFSAHRPVHATSAVRRVHIHFWSLARFFVECAYQCRPLFDRGIKEEWEYSPATRIGCHHGMVNPLSILLVMVNPPFYTLSKQVWNTRTVPPEIHLFFMDCDTMVTTGFLSYYIITIHLTLPHSPTKRRRFESLGFSIVSPIHYFVDFIPSEKPWQFPYN